MQPQQRIDQTEVPGTDRPMELWQRGDEFIIRVANRDLMTSRCHDSELALAHLACQRLPQPSRAHVLVGGLGMGYTLAAALDELGPQSTVVVAELVPGVVTWNREHLGHLADHPLDDPRTEVHVGDVADLVRSPERPFDAILLDVDNGPDSLTRDHNAWLYQRAGLHAARDALAPGGVLAVWSAFDDPDFTRRLRRADFHVERETVRAHRGRGARHVIWLARRPTR